MIARIVVKAETSDSKRETNFPISYYAVENGGECVWLHGIGGDPQQSECISRDDPPKDAYGVWSQEVFIMNDKGETIDRYPINPKGGFRISNPEND